MKIVLEKLILAGVCGIGVLYGAGTLYNVFVNGHVTGLEELPGILLALTLYSLGLIITAFMTLNQNKIGQTTYLFLIAINLAASICMNSMVRLDLAATDGLNRKFFYSCYLFNSCQFIVNEFYVNLMLYDDIPIPYLQVIRNLLILFSIGIPMFIIFYLTRAKNKII